VVLLHGSGRWLGVRALKIVALSGERGPRIPVAQREAVFRPFFRLNRSRNPETGGIGSGSRSHAMSPAVMAGTLNSPDSPFGGLRAIVRLPI
jgi:two-component system osmolarity sensor histidine kinase EnvZ